MEAENGKEGRGGYNRNISMRCEAGGWKWRLRWKRTRRKEEEGEDKNRSMRCEGGVEGGGD